MKRFLFFYKEVFRAWGEFLPNIAYRCNNIIEAMNEPIFLNPKIQHNNKMLYNKVFMDAGIRQIKDMVYGSFLLFGAITVW